MKTLILEITEFILIVLLIFLPIHYFIFRPFIVKGESMTPTFSDGDYLIIDELSFRFRPIERGEVVVFKFPKNPKESYIKRIIGLPGETVEIRNGSVFVDDSLLVEEYLNGNSWSSASASVTLSREEYFVLGDNRSHSFDSRSWGVLPKDFIVGRVALRLWPLTDVRAFAAPVY